LSQGEAFPIGNPQEYEFLKDKTYKIYDEGTVSVNGNYEMGVDGNSFFLKNRKADFSWELRRSRQEVQSKSKGEVPWFHGSMKNRRVQWCPVGLRDEGAWVGFCCLLSVRAFAV